jgi:signal transduction histidine kinase
VRALIGEAAALLRDVQSATQKVIADLSPPGLYDLGLASALQWLCVQMRGKDDLQVDLKTSVDDSKYDLDQRVLAYKIVRELLRNVVKPAGVKQARVVVTQSPGELRLEVSDAGVGFEWQLDLFESRDRGFGLWSVVDRVKDAKGEVTVDTAPGKGCRVRVLLPLAPAASAA